MKSAAVYSTGRYLPERIIPNEDLTQFSPEARRLIGEKTGVLARRCAADNECTSDLAIRAALACLQKAGVSPEDIEGIVVSTSSPDRMQPATATRVQHEIGAKRAFAFDINSVCSGGSFGIGVSDAFIRSGKYENILLIAAEMYSRILNKKDFSTYPFFGDGAGAVLFRADELGRKGILRSCLETDGAGNNTICVPGGGTMLPYEKITSPRMAYFKMKGEDVFAFSIDKGPRIIQRIIAETGVDIEDVKLFICHQANVNILHRIADILGLPRERFYVNLDRYGNTASASVLIALDEVLTGGMALPGDLVMLVTFGGGFSWGANLIRI